MPRYVILRHELPAGSDRPTHWDLMLEQQDVLRTWALERPLSAGERIAAIALVDHRLAYLDYEGPVSNDRGHVTRWDAGSYRVVHESASQLRIRLDGERSRGELILSRASEGQEERSESAQSWLAELLREGPAA